MTTDEKLELFQEQVSCGKNVYLWQYGADGQLLKSNCPHEATLAMAFSVFDCKRAMLEYARTDPGSTSCWAFWIPYPPCP